MLDAAEWASAPLVPSNEAVPQVQQSSGAEYQHTGLVLLLAGVAAVQ